MFKGGKSDKPKDKEAKSKESKKDLKDKKLPESDTEDSSSGTLDDFCVNRHYHRPEIHQGVFVC